MELNFDIRGNLKPYQKIELSLQSFKTHFVDEFDVNSETRGLIFESYTDYLKEFTEAISGNFIQWIDGSFVSSKRNPKDMDIVTLLEYETYEKHVELIEKRFRGENARSEFESIDAYFVKVYPSGHDRYFVTEYDLVYWYNWFTETKKNRAKKKFEKGFIALTFDTKTSENE